MFQAAIVAVRVADYSRLNCKAPIPVKRKSGNPERRIRTTGGRELLCQGGSTIDPGKEDPMYVREVMTPDVVVASPDDTLQRAAEMMIDIDAGVLPVGENDRLVGMLTDRDITIRAVAAGKEPT